jgi:catalase
MISTPTRYSFRLARTAVAAATVAIMGASPLAAFAADSAAAPTKSVPVAAVEALNVISGGPHAGYRANHAKGVLVTGSFVASKDAAALTMAPHFNSSKPVPVLVRFSNGTGFPAMQDTNPNASPHGIAIRFQLPGGASTDIVSISASTFPVATPEEFVQLLQAIGQSGPDAVKPTPVEKFLASHPIAQKWVSTPRPAPVSFGTLAFYGVNAFEFTNAKGQSKFTRYQILPMAGEKALSAADVAKAAPNYLMDELPARIAKAPVKFRLLAQVAENGDQTIDGSLAWPAERKLVELGVISLSATSPDQAKAQKALLFNPLSLTEGITASKDPVLLIRPAAYGVSFGQRVQ